MVKINFFRSFFILFFFFFVSKLRFSPCSLASRTSGPSWTDFLRQRNRHASSMAQRSVWSPGLIWHRSNGTETAYLFHLARKAYPLLTPGCILPHSTPQPHFTVIHRHRYHSATTWHLSYLTVKLRRFYLFPRCSNCWTMKKICLEFQIKISNILLCQFTKNMPGFTVNK